MELCTGMHNPRTLLVVLNPQHCHSQICVRSSDHGSHSTNGPDCRLDARGMTALLRCISRPRQSDDPGVACSPARKEMRLHVMV